MNCDTACGATGLQRRDIAGCDALSLSTLPTAEIGSAVVSPQLGRKWLQEKKGTATCARTPNALIADFQSCESSSPIAPLYGLLAPLDPRLEACALCGVTAASSAVASMLDGSASLRWKL